MAANQVDFKILPSDQFSVYSPATRSDKVITYFTLLSKLRGDILSVGQDDDPNNIVSAFYSSVGGTQTLHLVKADGSEITASQPEQIISGTVNFVSKFTTANDIGDSQIFDNGTNVGIGTTSMTHKLQLATGGVFADYYQLDTTYTNGFVVGAISWDIDNGTADIGLSSTLKLKIGQDDTWYVKNQSGSTITKGTVVYASGTLGASGRITIAPMIANGTIPSRFLLGIVAENILNGADGYVIAKGKIRQINTNAFNDGDVLWVSPTVAGALTVTEPTAPNLKLAVAFVVHKATNGILAVRTTTGVRIADASDVEYAGAADNSFLIYNSATGVWEDEAVGIFKTIAVAGQSSVVADTYDDTLTLVAGTNITITTDATTDSITINSTDQFVGTVTSVGTSAPLTGGTITTTGTIGITQSGVATDGYLSSTDWNTFNSKEPALTKGNLTEATSSVLTITGGTGAVIGTGTTIQVSQAGVSASGFLSSTDWNTFNNKQGTITLTTTGSTGAATFISNTLNIPNYADQFVGTVTSVAALTLGTTGTDLSSSVVNSTTTPVITLNVPTASATNRGALSSTDWTTFNSKEPALTKGNLTEATSAVLTITGGTGAVIGTGTSIQVAQSGASTSGFLSSTDWNTFNGKASNSFTTIAVATQSNIVADSATDTLTVVAGSGVTITTDATTDTLTISATGSGGTVTSISTTAPITGGTITGTGTIAITQSGAAADGYLSSTDWNTFNGKQNAITLTTTGTTGAATLIGATLNIPNYADQFVGTVTSVDMSVPTGFAVSGNPITTSGTLAVAFASGYSLPTNASQTTWDTAYNDSITAFAYNTSNGVLTLTQQDAGTLTATVTLQPFSTTDLTEGTNLYYTDTRSRLALSAGTGITYDSATGVITNSAPDQTVSLTGAGTTTISGAYPSFTITSNDQYDGTVTSVDLTAGTGISVSGGPITTSGSITVTNTAPDQTVVLTAGTGISTSGTYPNFTVTNSAPDQTVVLTASTGITTSGTYPNFTIANSAPDQTVVLTGGTGITTSGTYPNFTITNSSPSSGGTVTDVAALTLGTTGTDLSSTVVNGTTTPVITLQVPTASAANRGALSSTDWSTFNNKQGTITLTTTGSTGAATFISNTLNIPSYTDQFVGTVTSVDLIAGTGITVSGGPITTSGSITVNNSDRGSSQNIFKNINVITSQDWDDSEFVWNVDDGSWSGGIDQEAIVADNNNDTLFIESVGGISITTDSATDTIYFDNIDKGSGQNIFKNFAVSGQSTIVADLNDDTLTVASGTGITLTTNASTDTLTITNSAPDQTVVLTASTGITTSGTYPSFTIANSAPDQTVALTAGAGITVSGTYPSFTVANSQPANPPSRTESLNFKAAAPYTVVTPFDKVVIDFQDVELPSPSTIDSGNKVLAIVTLEVENTDAIGFTGLTLRLYNQTTAAVVTNAQIRWSSYMYPSSTEFGYTSFTYHIPIDDTGVSLADVIELQLQLEVGACDINVANFTLMSITK